MDTDISSEDILELISHKLSPHEIFLYTLMLEGMSEEEKIGKQLYIDPSVCINCGACVPECPVDAIYSDEKEAIISGDEKSVYLNYEFFGLTFVKK